MTGPRQYTYSGEHTPQVIAPLILDHDPPPQGPLQLAGSTYVPVADTPSPQARTDQPAASSPHRHDPQLRRYPMTPGTVLPGPNRTRRDLRRRALQRAAPVRRTALVVGSVGIATVAAVSYGWSHRSSDPTNHPSDAAATGTAGPPVAVPAELSLEHVLNRVTYGPTNDLRDEVTTTGIQQWLAQQLHPASIADPASAIVTGMLPRLGWTVQQAYALQESKANNGSDFYDFQLDVPLQHMSRAIWSTRQLGEILVDFWSNHLNITTPGGKGGLTRHRYDADVIRKHALGRFEDMLLASATHPCMLDYLDAAQSTRQSPNENYARELLELHTVGIDGGYTERDIKQTALLLTGWELKDGVATWVNSRHYTKPVTIMGVTYPNGSGGTARQSAQSLVMTLARHPKTAQRLAHKLATHMVADDPPAALVTHMAQAYQDNNTAIGPMLRVMFASQEFADSAGSKVRRPAERLYATMRALGVPFKGDREGMKALYWGLNNLGHAPMYWPRPDGFPDVASAWKSPAAALEQLNQTIGYVNAWYPKTLGLVEPQKMFAQPPRTRAGVIDAVSHKLLGRTPNANEQAALKTLLTKTPFTSTFGAGTWEQDQTIALTAITLLMSPSFINC